MFANVPGFEKIAASGERKYLKKPEILGFLKRSNDIYPFFVHSQLVAHLWPSKGIENSSHLKVLEWDVMSGKHVSRMPKKKPSFRFAKFGLFNAERSTSKSSSQLPRQRKPLETTKHEFRTRRTRPGQSCDKLKGLPR